MTRSLEAPKQTPSQTETNTSSRQETPLFDALQLEYLQGGNSRDLEVVGSDKFPIFAVLGEGNGSDAARKAYKNSLAAVPADVSESDIPVYLEMMDHEARQLDLNFARPAIIAESNDKIYYANGGTTGFAQVSKDSGTRLSATENSGVITELPADHKLVIADNDLLEQLDKSGVLNLDSIVNRDLYPLYSAVLIGGKRGIGTNTENLTHTDSLSPQEVAAAQRKERKLRKLRLPLNATDQEIQAATEARLDKLGLPYDATPQQIQQAIADRKAARRQASSNDDNTELKLIEDELDMTRVFADDQELQAEIAAANSTPTANDRRAAGFTDSQTAILDKMKARRTAPTQPTNQELNAEPEETDPEIAHERKELIKLRNAMAGVAAKRQGRLFNLKNNKYTDLEAEYDQQLARLGKLKCAALLNDETKTDADKNVGVIAFIFEEQQRLRKATTERLKGTPVSKMIEWVNSGTKTQRLLKGAAVGAGGVLIGAGAGAIVGAAAGVGLAAAATVAATSAMRFGRYYAKEDNKLGRGMTLLNTTQEEQAKLDATQALGEHSSDDKFSIASKQFKELFDADTKKEQEKRRKSARHAIGGVALGMVVGGTVAYAISELIDAPQVAAQSIDPAPEGSPPASTDGPEVKQPEITPESTHIPEYGHDASTVTLGEGWYQTFSEIGITDSGQQYALLHNQALMQELANQGLAYPDAALGGWGMNMTTDGKMPIESLKLIEDYAKRSGYDLAS